MKVVYIIHTLILYFTNNRNLKNCWYNRDMCMYLHFLISLMYKDKCYI